MNTTTRISLLLIGFTLALGSRAGAKGMPEGKVFINVNGGAQTQSRSVDNSFSIPIYGQTATVATTATIPSGGLFDLSVGYKVRPSIGVAFGFSTFSGTGAVAGATASFTVFLGSAARKGPKSRAGQGPQRATR